MTKTLIVNNSAPDNRRTTIFCMQVDTYVPICMLKLENKICIISGDINVYKTSKIYLINQWMQRCREMVAISSPNDGHPVAPPVSRLCYHVSDLCISHVPASLYFLIDVHQLIKYIFEVFLKVIFLEIFKNSLFSNFNIQNGTYVSNYMQKIVVLGLSRAKLFTIKVLVI